MKKLKEYINEMFEKEQLKFIYEDDLLGGDDDGGGDDGGDGDSSDDSSDDPKPAKDPKKAKEEEKKKEEAEKSNIKFIIWKEPDKKVDWIADNENYQKIEYKYEDKKKGISVDFLLGLRDNKWHLWVGKIGACSYDDDPYCTFDTSKFSEAIVQALDKVTEMLKEIRREPLNYIQFYRDL